VNRNSCDSQENAGSGGAGVSPAVFLIATLHKNAGGTPAPPDYARHSHGMEWMTISESLMRNPGKGSWSPRARAFL